MGKMSTTKTSLAFSRRHFAKLTLRRWKLRFSPFTSAKFVGENVHNFPPRFWQPLQRIRPRGETSLKLPYKNPFTVKNLGLGWNRSETININKENDEYTNIGPTLLERCIGRSKVFFEIISFLKWKAKKNHIKGNIIMHTNVA